MGFTVKGEYPFLALIGLLAIFLFILLLYPSTVSLSLNFLNLSNVPTFWFAGQMEVGYIIPVLFLSNSLGTPLLPKTVETQDFEMALSQAEDKDSLKKWYKLDSNAQPPCYRLQPVASHIPGFKVTHNYLSLLIPPPKMAISSAKRDDTEQHVVYQCSK